MTERSIPAAGPSELAHGLPRAAYLHVPFCARRCGYCNFTVVANRADLVAAYLRAIAVELESLGQPRPVDTLFFGGGTPTQLKGAELAALLESASRWHPLAPGAEFSVEANPADLDRDTLRQLADAGTTRISLGAQSFRADKLRLLERDHSAADIRRSVDFTRAAGLAVSIDLIFGAPGETLDQWRDDLDLAIALEPDHVSTYGLTYERGAAFWSRRRRGELVAAPEELERQMYIAAIDTLAAAGLKQYEVSNFARVGRRCRHNETYWSGGEYYAAGPGASRYVGGVRQTNHRSTSTYIKRVLSGQSPVAESERLSPEDRARELLVFGLRRIEGVERRWLRQTSGFSLDELVGPQLAKHAALGLFDDDGSRVRLTREGLLLSDAIWPSFLAATQNGRPE